MPRFLTPLLVLTVSLAISGCATTVAAPTPTVDASVPATTTPTPTPTPEPTAASIGVSATAMTVFDTEGAPILSVPFTVPLEEAAAQLAETLDLTPTVTSREAHSCEIAASEYTFGEGFVLSSTLLMVPPAQYTVWVISPTTTTGLPIIGPDGVQVGMALDDVLTAVPSADDYDPSLLLLQDLDNSADRFDPDDSGSVVTGTTGYVRDGVLAGFLSPVRRPDHC